MNRSENRNTWTDERIELLKAMWKRGQSAAEISRQMPGTTRNGVIAKIDRLRRSGVDLGRVAAPSAPTVRTRPLRTVAPRPKGQPMPKGVMVLPPLKGGSCTEKATANRAANVEARAKPAPNVLAMARKFEPLPGHEPVPFGGKGCKWPVSGEGMDMLQCGCERDGAGPYCTEHASASRQAVQPRDRTSSQLARSLRRYTSYGRAAA